MPLDHVYDVTIYILAGMLALGFFCNWLIKPLDANRFMRPEDVAALQEKTAAAAAQDGTFGISRRGF